MTAGPGKCFLFLTVRFFLPQSRLVVVVISLCLQFLTELLVTPDWGKIFVKKNCSVELPWRRYAVFDCCQFLFTNMIIIAFLNPTVFHAVACQ